MGDVIKIVPERDFDYSCAAFMATFEERGNTYYACFCPEAVLYNDALSFTGRYIVTMLHPKLATITFFLRHFDNQWLLDTPLIREIGVEPKDSLFVTEYPFQLDQETILWCGDIIDKRLA